MHHPIRERQLSWARSRDLDIDADGFVAEPESHLLWPLSDEARRELAASPTSPLGEPGKRPPIAALESTWALLASTVEPWRGREPTPLAVALESRRPVSASGLRLAHAAHWTHGPPQLARVEIPLWIAPPDRGGVPTAVLARYAEPYLGEDRRLPGELAAAEWSELPGCRDLARDLSCSPARFTALAIAPILHASLVLTRTLGPRGFRLVVLWHREPCARGSALAREHDRLRMRIGGEVDLVCVTWHTLFERLAALDPPAPLDELCRRYLGAPAR